MKDYFKIVIAVLPMLIIGLTPEIKDNFVTTALLIFLSAVLLFGWALQEMSIAALAFVIDPDARKTSRHRYDNGNAMSVREAKKLGLVE